MKLWKKALITLVVIFSTLAVAFFLFNNGPLKTVRILAFVKTQSDPNFILGNPTGKNVVVEFVDYKCPYCLELHKNLLAAIDGRDDIKVIVRPVPILSDESLDIASLVFAAARQGKGRELHLALMGGVKPTTKAEAMDIARGLGLDMTKLEADAKNPDVQRPIVSNYLNHQDLGFPGVPALVIGSQLYMPKDGIPDVEKLKQILTFQP